MHSNRETGGNGRGMRCRGFFVAWAVSVLIMWGGLPARADVLGQGCDVICPQGSTPENEPVCADFTVSCNGPGDCPGGEQCVEAFCRHEDRVNGGCGATGAYSALECGLELCGTSGTYCEGNCACEAPEDVNGDGFVDLLDVFCILDVIAGDFSACTFQSADVAPCGGNGILNLFDLSAVLHVIEGQSGCCGWVVHADADWYAVDVVQDTLITISVEAEFAARYRLVAAVPQGEDRCAAYGTIHQVTANPCEPVTIEQCLLAGDYFFVVEPLEGTEVPCGSEYTLTMDCGSCGLLCGSGDGNCCDEGGNGSAGCENVDCCLAVCDQMPRCCSDPWNAACAALAGEVCGVCPPPASDECLNAGVLLVPSTADGTTKGATVDVAPICSFVEVNSPGVWYSVIGTGNTMTATVCNSADFDTQISVYCAGCDVLTCVLANNDRLGCGGFTSRVDWCSQDGVEYLLLVHGRRVQDTGNFVLNVFDNGVPCAFPPDCGVPICGDGKMTGDEECDDGNRNPGDGCDENCHIEPPTNDLCADAILVSSSNLPATFTTDGAETDGPPHPSCLFSGSEGVFNDIWYHHVAECDGTLRIETCGSSFDTRLVIYNGCDVCPGSDEVKLFCDDNDCGFQSQAWAAASEGQCYTIRVGSTRNGDTGPGVLTIACLPTEPDGACCVGGVCIGNMKQGDCTLAGGVWTIGEDCATFVCVPTYDECEGRVTLPCNGSVVVDNTNATNNFDDPTSPFTSSGVGGCWDGEGIGTVFLEFEAQSESIRIRTDLGIELPADDSEFAVFEVSQQNICNESNWTLIGCSEDEGSGAGGFNGNICVTGLTVGNIYVVELASFAGATRGRYTVTTECRPCP